jgi:hypothetical protein
MAKDDARSPDRTTVEALRLLAPELVEGVLRATCASSFLSHKNHARPHVKKNVRLIMNCLIAWRLRQNMQKSRNPKRRVRF